MDDVQTLYSPKYLVFPEEVKQIFAEFFGLSMEREVLILGAFQSGLFF